VEARFSDPATLWDISIQSGFELSQLLKSSHETQNQSTSAAALKHKANVFREWIAALKGGPWKSKHFLGPPAW
jgi:hypothetical protein